MEALWLQNNSLTYQLAVNHVADWSTHELVNSLTATFF